MSFHHVPNFVRNSSRKAESPQHKPGSPRENWWITATSQNHFFATNSEQRVGVNLSLFFVAPRHPGLFATTRWGTFIASVCCLKIDAWRCWRSTEMTWLELIMRKARSTPQTWIALGKLVATYNFAASLFLPAQTLYLVAVVDVVEDGSWKLAVPNL